MDNTVLAAVRAAATTEHAAASTEGSVPLRDHTNAVNAARAEGKSEGLTEGATDERKRVAGILDHDNAKGREALARKLAFTTSMSVEEAGAFMGDLPASDAPRTSRLDAAMAREPQPRVSPNGGAQPSAAVIDTQAIYASRAAAAKPLS